jgi:hypothetical protein
VNAQVEYVAPRKHLILLNMGLIHTVYTLAKACASQLRLNREIPLLEWQPNLSLEVIREHFKKYFSTFLETKGAVPSADHLDTSLDDSQHHFLVRMLHYAEKFIIAHEMAHIICGHLTSDRLTRSVHGDEAVDVYEMNVAQEFEADSVALELTFVDFPPEDRVDDIYVRAAIAGVNLVFRTIEVLERLLDVRSQTHPPAESRRLEFHSFIWGRYDSRTSIISRKIDSLLDDDLFVHAVPGWK